MAKKIYKGSQRPGNLSVTQLINKVGAYAVRACMNTGILASVAIGQAIKESANGNDYKAFVFNNYFGHMASGSWSGDSVTAKQSGAGPYWRIYPTIEAAFEAHVKNLLQGKYKLQGVALKKTPLAQLNALQKAGYNVGADKHTYAKAINNIINTYNLDEFDNHMLAMERQSNPNGLAFSEQDGITKALHNLFG